MTTAAETEARTKLVARRSQIDRSQRHNETDGAALREDRERTSTEEIAEVLVSLSERERREVDAIDAALLRLEKGTWGHCARCRAKIAGKRLSAMPEATTCLDCATEVAKA